MTAWYRYEDVGIEGGGVEIYLRKFEVLRETPKGVWLDVYGSARFALRECRKRFACPTLDEAKQSFLARKKRQIQIYDARARRARRALAQAENL